jgi:hypothetical protein
MYADGLRLLARMIARHHTAAKWLQYGNPNRENFMTGDTEQPHDEESCD